MTFFSPFRRDAIRDVNRFIRLRFVRGILAFLLLASFAIFFIEATSQRLLAPGSNVSLTFSTLLTVIFAAVSLYLLNRTRYQQPIINFTTAYIALLTLPTTDDVELLAVLTLAFVANALLSGRITFLIINALLIARIILHMDNEVGGFASIDITAQTFIAQDLPLLVGIAVVGMVPLLVSGLVRVFTNALEITVADAQRNANLLEASATVGQIMARYLSLDELMTQAVTIIRDRFGFYHVQIFIVDEDKRLARLTASTGDIGKQLLENQHSLPINANSIVGRTIQAGEPVVARDAQQSTEHAFNPFLPQTRAELGVPILDGDRVIGAIDVQSMRVEAFTNTEIQALQVLAGQLATAIRNARLFEQQERNVRENQRLLFEAESSLREIQRLNRQLTRQSWSEYLTSDRVSGVTLADQRLRPGASWSESMKQATQRRRAIVDTEEHRRIVSVPIELRNEIVGALEVELNNDQTDEDAIELLSAVANRLALSLDNARLFEETQEISAQEQRLNDLVAQYQAADSVDDLLQITLQGLAETLGAQHGAIRLGGAMPANGANGHGEQT